MSKEAMKLALEALEPLVRRAAPWGEMDWLNGCKAITAIKKALAQPEQEPVGDALYFAQWTADKKDLSNYVLVGSLSLAGIEDNLDGTEFGESEIERFEAVIESLQEKLINGRECKKVPLIAYIGGHNRHTTPPPQRTEQEPVAVQEKSCRTCIHRDTSIKGVCGVCRFYSHHISATPPQRKPLTDDQWQVIADTLDCFITRSQKDIIEAKLKENT